MALRINLSVELSLVKSRSVITRRAVRVGPKEYYIAVANLRLRYHAPHPSGAGCRMPDA
jgi:hypothetical protein